MQPLERRLEVSDLEEIYPSYKIFQIIYLTNLLERQDSPLILKFAVLIEDKVLCANIPVRMQPLDWPHPHLMIDQISSYCQMHAL